MSKDSFYREGIPIWRLSLWVALAMGGVAYFAKPETETKRYMLWGFIHFVGVVFFGAGLMLNRIAADRERARAWVCEHAGRLRLILAICGLGSVLLGLYGFFVHK